MPTPTFTVIEPSTDQPFAGLRNVGRENAILQQHRPLNKDSKDWRDLQHGEFGRYTYPGSNGGYHYIVRGEDQP